MKQKNVELLADGSVRITYFNNVINHLVSSILGEDVVIVYGQRQLPDEEINEYLVSQGFPVYTYIENSSVHNHIDGSHVMGIYAIPVIVVFDTVEELITSLIKEM